MPRLRYLHASHRIVSNIPTILSTRISIAPDDLATDETSERPVYLPMSRSLSALAFDLIEKLTLIAVLQELREQYAASVIRISVFSRVYRHDSKAIVLIPYAVIGLLFLRPFQELFSSSVMSKT